MLFGHFCNVVVRGTRVKRGFPADPLPRFESFWILAHMEIVRDWQLFPAGAKGGVLCVGNFDGVHLGHGEMLSRGKREATSRGVPFVIMTFEPHPFTVLKPEIMRPPLTTWDQRLQLIKGFAPDAIVAVEPTREFLNVTAEDFLREIVAGKFGSTAMVEGPTFNFGRGAKGRVAMLEKEGPALGFETIIVSTREVVLSDMTVVKVSSSLIRWLVEQGRVLDVATCLGRPYALRGQVVAGAKRGRTIGFPTANVAARQLLPAAGIYAGRAIVDGIPHRAAISIGNNPTFIQDHVTVEAYLLDFDADLYGKTIDVEFHRWLRGMLTFSGVDPLIKQITHDVTQTRELISQEHSK